MLGLISKTKIISAPLFNQTVSEILIEGPAAAANRRKIPQYSIIRKANNIPPKLTGALYGTPPGGPSEIKTAKALPIRRARKIAQGIIIKAAMNISGLSKPKPV